MISLQTGNCSNVLSRSPNWAAALTFHALRLFGTWLRNLTANKMGSRLVPWQCCSCYVKIGDSHSYSLRHYRGSKSKSSWLHTKRGVSGKLSKSFALREFACLKISRESGVTGAISRIDAVFNEVRQLVDLDACSA